jgi:hypothetical protein
LIKAMHKAPAKEYQLARNPQADSEHLLYLWRDHSSGL